MQLDRVDRALGDVRRELGLGNPHVAPHADKPDPPLGDQTPREAHGGPEDLGGGVDGEKSLHGGPFRSVARLLGGCLEDH